MSASVVLSSTEQDKRAVSSGAAAAGIQSPALILSITQSGCRPVHREQADALSLLFRGDAMRTVVKGASLAALLMLAATGFAQNNKVKPAVGPADDKDEPGVHRMEIYNGPLRTVHYIYRGLAPSEAQAVRELERAENENILASDLLALRQQYASGERTFDAQRRFRQEQLYGYSSSEIDTGNFTAYRR